MGYYCTVPQCTSLAGKTKNVKFHRFPRDVTMADKWNLILKRGKPYTKYSKVCSLHFTQADYNVTTMGQWKTLSKDAVPSRNLPKLNPDGTPMVIRKSRTVKYKESKKDVVVGEKTEKWQQVNAVTHTPAPANAVQETTAHSSDAQDVNLAFRLQALNALANNISPQHQLQLKPKKQDAFMQTDPVLSEEEENQPNNSYSEASENSFNSEQLEYPVSAQQYQKDAEYEANKSYELPKDYTKPEEDYIPLTNEEYNKEAEKYALERKSHNGYEKPVIEYQKPVIENGYQKIPDIYAGFAEKQEYQNRTGTATFVYQNGYTDSVEILRNQQHNLQMLQEQHRITENQNFFNESHIKQEIDMDASTVYTDDQRRTMEQQRLLEQLQHQVKQEPDTGNGCDNVMPPQESPYYATNGHSNVSAGGYYEQLSRPGPELLIAKQNALAAHTQLWQNTMKRPFFYSESLHYNSSQLV